LALPYNYDGLLSTPVQVAIKTSMTLPPLPSTDALWWESKWLDYAACKGKTDLFFQHRCSTRCDQHPSGCDRLQCVCDAKEICAACPVLAHCRIWSIEDSLQHGIAGAMTERERLRFRQQREQL